MIEYSLVISAWKTLLSFWALFWIVRVLRIVRVGHQNLFWLMASTAMLLVGAGMAGGYYGTQHLFRVWVDCGASSGVLGQPGGVATNIVYSIAAAMAGISARNIYYSKGFDRMALVIAACLSVISLSSIIIGEALRVIWSAC